jgi:hypothetical protein
VALSVTSLRRTIMSPLRERGITDVMVNEILKLEAPKKEKQ